jgi:hypothetical protein
MGNNWTWGYLLVTSAIFGFWLKSVEAGTFMFLFAVFFARMLYMTAEGNSRREILLTRIEQLC